jgi:membrane-associated phospholipid phosphatase
VPLLAPLLLSGTAAVTSPGDLSRAALPATEIAVFAGGVWGALVLAAADMTPKGCRWCASNPLDESARALRWSKKEHRKLAGRLSNATTAVTPVWAVGSLAIAAAADRRASPVDPVLVVESGLIAMMVNQLIKVEVARERPDVHHGRPDPSFQGNLSFSSGLVTWCFATAVAGGTVASMRGYRGAPAVWAGGLLFASVNGYLRLAEDRHWLTDVLAGAAMGALAGALVPRLHIGDTQGSSDHTTAQVAAQQAAAAPPTWISWGGVF